MSRVEDVPSEPIVQLMPKQFEIGVVQEGSVYGQNYISNPFNAPLRRRYVITVVSFHAISGTYNEFTPLIVLVKIVAAVFSIGAVGVE